MRCSASDLHDLPCRSTLEVMLMSASPRHWAFSCDRGLAPLEWHPLVQCAWSELCDRPHADRVILFLLLLRLMASPLCGALRMHRWCQRTLVTSPVGEKCKRGKDIPCRSHLSIVAPRKAPNTSLYIPLCKSLNLVSACQLLTDHRHRIVGCALVVSIDDMCAVNDLVHVLHRAKIGVLFVQKCVVATAAEWLSCHSITVFERLGKTTMTRLQQCTALPILAHLSELALYTHGQQPAHFALRLRLAPRYGSTYLHVSSCNTSPLPPSSSTTMLDESDVMSRSNAGETLSENSRVITDVAQPCSRYTLNRLPMADIDALVVKEMTLVLTSLMSSKSLASRVAFVRRCSVLQGAAATSWVRVLDHCVRTLGTKFIE